MLGHLKGLSAPKLAWANVNNSAKKQKLFGQINECLAMMRCDAIGPPCVKAGPIRAASCAHERASSLKR